MTRIRRKVPSPTRLKLRSLDAQCDEMPCFDPCNESNWSCDKCKISSAYEKISGVRIEDLGGCDIIA